MAKATTLNHSPGLGCIDCHMPFTSKSGTTRGASGFKGDVRTHLFKIATDTASMFIEDGSAVRDDDTRSAALSPGFACLGCHNDDPDDNIPEKTLIEAAAGSARMHNDFTSVAPVNDLKVNIYRNPSSSPTRIRVNLPVNAKVERAVYNTSGQVVYVLTGKDLPQGDQVIYWDGKSNTGENVKPGYYFIKVSAGNLTSVDKLVLMQ